MSEEKKKKKGRSAHPAHEAAKWMLEVDPWGYVVTLATMYGKWKAIVPPKEIPVLVNAFRQAKKKMIDHIDKAITTLERQAKGAKKKEEEKKKEKKEL